MQLSLAQAAPAKSAELLIRAVQQISTAANLAEIAEVVKHAARAATGADGASFVLRDRDQCFYMDEDAIAPLWKGRRFPMSACVSGWAMHHRIPAVIADVEHDDRVPYDAYRPTFVRSLVMVPIRSAAPLGAIGIYWAQRNEAGPATVHWLQALADATSAAIEAVRAHEEAARLRVHRGVGPDPANGPGRDGAVRMCAWTKRFFHDGRWLSPEAFLRTRFGVETTHTISEGALDDFAKELEGEVPGR